LFAVGQEAVGFFAVEPVAACVAAATDLQLTAVSHKSCPLLLVGGILSVYPAIQAMSD